MPTPLYEKWIPFIGLLVVLALGALQYRSNRHPPSGVYIAIMAVAASVVTPRSPKNLWEKTVWIAIFFVLSGLEIQNLYRDRAEQNQEQRNARREERDAFQAIANRLTAEMAANQRQFEASLAKLNSIASLTIESNNSAIGGDSYCYFDFLGTIEPSRISNRPVFIHLGKYPLYDVDIRIADLSRLDSLGFPDFAGPSHTREWDSSRHRLASRRPGRGDSICKSR